MLTAARESEQLHTYYLQRNGKLTLHNQFIDQACST